ncbi:hypothetical protein HZS_3707 [Henneguya salminicola]|nr:hypothetical protein HZS_3707 [Henneguya salminicola]
MMMLAKWLNKCNITITYNNHLLCSSNGCCAPSGRAERILNCAVEQLTLTNSIAGRRHGFIFDE